MAGVGVRNTQGVTVIHSSDEFPPAGPPSSCGVRECTLPAYALAEGTYFLRAGCSFGVETSTSCWGGRTQSSASSSSGGWPIARPPSTGSGSPAQGLARWDARGGPVAPPAGG
jgi:hypothetical protein